MEHQLYIIFMVNSMKADSATQVQIKLRDFEMGMSYYYYYNYDYDYRITIIIKEIILKKLRYIEQSTNSNNVIGHRLRKLNMYSS